MPKKWIILDCNYLCHRAKYSTGELSYKGSATGVVYGFLKAVTYLLEKFDSPNIVFCWDSKTSKRKQICPSYKKSRENPHEGKSKKEIAFDIEFRKQMKMLRKVYLKKIGYRNVFCQKGMEGDDIIASVCLNLKTEEEAVIVTADKDMYQLIKGNVSVYNPAKNKMITLQNFYKEYGILPRLWITVKCFAGCSADEVKGIQGVGEVTALKWLRGLLKPNLKIAQRIKKEGEDITNKNYPLVALPFEGTKIFKLKKDRLSEKGWEEVMKRLGLTSLRDKAPFIRKRKYNK